jgi:hypothetical protein
MKRSPLYRAALLLTLTLLLSAPAVEAGQSFRGGASVGSVEDLFARVWSFLSSAWKKNGCELDPNGLQESIPGAPVATDNGCELDPNGRCLAGKSAPLPSDNGCHIDPDGRCLSVQSVPLPAESGCHIDPNGLCLP